MLENRPATVSAPRRHRTLGMAPSKKLRAQKTNNPIRSLSKNTARGRRAADLAAAYYAALGNPPEIERQAAILAAAELQVLAEEARSAALRSGTVDLDQVVRVQGAADRALRRLGIKTGPTEPPYVPLRERLMAELEAEHAASGDDDESGGATAEYETPASEPEDAA